MSRSYCLYDPVQVDIDEVLPRRGSPVPEQVWLHMREPFQGLSEQRIVAQVNLPDR
jgi:hypothetical protein